MKISSNFVIFLVFFITFSFFSNLVLADDLQAVEGFTAMKNSSNQGKYNNYRNQQVMSYWEYAGWYNYNGYNQKVEWKTATVPSSYNTGKVTFIWTGSNGIQGGEHDLYLNGKKILTFTSNVNIDTILSSGNYELFFDYKNNNSDNAGVYYLTAPALELVSGQQTIRVEGTKDGGSLDWFMVHNFTDTIKYENNTGGLQKDRIGKSSNTQDIAMQKLNLLPKRPIYGDNFYSLEISMDYNSRYFAFYVPYGVKRLDIQTSGTDPVEKDALDLYMGRDYIPSTVKYDKKSINNETYEYIYVSNPLAGWYIVLAKYKDDAWFTFSSSLDINGTDKMVIPYVFMDNTTGQIHDYITLPTEGNIFKIETTTEGNKDNFLDLYSNYNDLADRKNYDYKSEGSTANEKIIIKNPHLFSFYYIGVQHYTPVNDGVGWYKLFSGPTDCVDNSDCDNNKVCLNNTCTFYSCHDGIRNGDETGIDCGGICNQDDCCMNGYIDFNLGEEGVDCGGSCQLKCDCRRATCFAQCLLVGISIIDACGAPCGACLELASCGLCAACVGVDIGIVAACSLSCMINPCVDCSINGHIESCDGLPEIYNVSYSWEQCDPWCWWTMPDTFITGSNGNFITSVWNNRHYRFIANDFFSTRQGSALIDVNCGGSNYISIKTYPKNIFLSGIVTDKKTGKPIEGAKVTSEPYKTAYTDKYGEYSFTLKSALDDYPLGNIVNFTITVEKTNYTTESKKISIGCNPQPKLNFSLNSSSSNIQPVEGFSSIVTSSNQGKYNNYRNQQVMSYWEYASISGNYIEWRTATVPSTYTIGKATFIWTGSNGIRNGLHDLYLNGNKIMTFNSGQNADKTWTNGNYELFFDYKNNYADNAGVYYLTVPVSAITPNSKSLIKIKAAQGGGGLDWIMVHNFTDTIKYETNTGGLRTDHIGRNV